MSECRLINLGSCLPEKFFEFLLDILNAPITPFLNLTLKMFSEPINLSSFVDLWVIIIYTLSMFYALLLVATGFSFMISGHDPVKRDNSKQWLRDVIIMIILIQASFFIYQLAIDLSSSMTSAMLTQLDENFFLVEVEGLEDIAMAILFSALYLITLIITTIILVIRHAVVAVGVALFPLSIFFYFIKPLKQYGSLILNFLGVCIFIVFFDSILLIGFSKLVNLPVFEGMQIIVLVSAFMVINVFMAFLMLFSIVKAGFSVYSGVKKIGR